MGRRFHALVVVVALVSFVAPVPAHAGGDGSWIHPVDGTVVRPFDPPHTRFGNGHLGAELLVEQGTPVRAAGPGVVTFAGSVAGSRHVVIAHAGNLRTSYSFLASIRVRRGESVAAGDIVGTAGGAGEDHDGSVLHFGLRAGDTYLDPMGLFRPIDLTEIVHLAPTSDPPRPQPPANERRGLVAGFVHVGSWSERQPPATACSRSALRCRPRRSPERWPGISSAGIATRMRRRLTAKVVRAIA